MRKNFWSSCRKIRMIKKARRKGFAMGSFPWDCYNCICRLCTGWYCRYKRYNYGFYRFRCAKCVDEGGRPKVYECDDFVNKLVVPRRYKFTRRSRAKGEIERRLDAIMEHFNIDLEEN